MKNIMHIGAYKALISYDPAIQLFRGEFLELNGGADFYAPDIEGLQREGQLSLAIFLDECAKRGISPTKTFSGKFVLRLSPEIHQAATIAAASSGLSLNQWAVAAIDKAARVGA